MFLSRNLQYTYKGENPITYPDIQLEKGESCLVLGPSGAGKSTLLYLLAGLLKPDKGYIELENTDYNSMSEPDLNRFRAKNIGIIWQEMHYIPSLNVKENLQAYAWFLRLKVSDQRINELAESLGFTHFLEKPLHKMSRGEVQKVAVARALLNKPALILADEPTSSLDDHNAQKVIELLLQQCKDACLLLVTHDQRIQGKSKHQINL